MRRCQALGLAVPFALALSAAPLQAQWSLEGSALVARLEHRVDAGYGVAASTGTTFGAAALVRYGGTVELEGHGMGGTLVADPVARDDRTLGELGARVGVLPLPWLAVQAVGTVRSYDLAPARQRWTEVGAGTELRLDFAGTGIRGIIRTTILPHVAVSGMPGPDFGFASAAGFRVVHGRLVGTAEYSLERYAFPTTPDAADRHEQLSGLTLTFGAHW